MDQQAKLSPRCRAATNRQSNRYQGPGSIRPRTHEPMLSRGSDAGKMPNKHMMAQLQGREGMQGPDMCCVGFAKLAVLGPWLGGAAAGRMSSGKRPFGRSSLGAGVRASYRADGRYDRQ
jgi:hypothetical protein